MNGEHPKQEIELRQQVEQSECVLQKFEEELRAVDSELEELTQNNRQYDVLSQVCRSLEELDTLNAAQLFWDGRGDAADHLGSVRRKIEEFHQQIARIESRRQSICDKIDAQNIDLDELHHDLHSVIEQEERRKNNWLIEREAESRPYRPQVMPWSRGYQEEDRRFRRSLGVSVLASFALAMLIGTIALPIMERPKSVKPPERIARLVEERLKAPPPLPPEPLAEPVVLDETLPEPEPELAREPPPEPTEEPVFAQVEQPVVREQVKSKGLLAFRKSFANRADARPAAQLGSQARLSNAGDKTVGRTQRLMVSTSAPGSSGGIDLSDISRDVDGGGQAIDGVAVSRVASTIGGGEPERPLSGGASAGRTDEEIQIVFDRYKAAVYRLYNRELRKNPTLRGQVVLRLTIEPDGSVSLCQLQSSDMGAPALAQKIVDQVRTFDFGAKQDIVAVTIIYPIDFLPAA